MGIYVPLWDQPGVDAPRITEHTFCSPDDVLEWGRRDRLVTWKTWPEVRHLDQDGVIHCDPNEPYRLVGDFGEV